MCPCRREAWLPSCFFCVKTARRGRPPGRPAQFCTALLAKNDVIAKPVRTLASQSASPVPKPPLPKGGWHGAAVTGGYISVPHLLQPLRRGGRLCPPAWACTAPLAKLCHCEGAPRPWQSVIPYSPIPIFHPIHKNDSFYFCTGIGYTILRKILASRCKSGYNCIVNMWQYAVFSGETHL